MTFYQLIQLRKIYIMLKEKQKRTKTDTKKNSVELI